MNQHEFVPVTNGADDRTLMLSDKRWESVHPFLVQGTCFFPFRYSFAFHSAFHRVLLQASPAPPSLSFRAQRAIMCYILVSMALQKHNAFSRRLPDLVTEELVFVLSQKTSYEFKQLFEVVHDNLRRRNAANGGEEMLRLRAYEKLQNLVFRGAVKKSGKFYTGNSAALAAMAANAPHAAAITSNP
jgi:hypothetical protein